MAARVNSSWAPRGPRSRNRPSRKMRFEMREAHLDLFAFTTRLLECARCRRRIGPRRGHARECYAELCEPGSWAASGFKWTWSAVGPVAQIQKRRTVIHERAGRRQGLASWAGIGIRVCRIAKIAAREGTIFPVRLVDDGDMWRDPLLLDQPVQHGGRAIGGISGEPLRLETEALFGSLHHRPCRANLGLADSA